MHHGGVALWLFAVVILRVDALCFTPPVAGFVFRGLRSSPATVSHARHVRNWQTCGRISMATGHTEDKAPVADSPMPHAQRLWDAHCHVHLSGQVEAIAKLQENVTLSLMGTRTTDWKDIISLSSSYPDRILPSFGLHPWWAHEDQGNWEEELAALLASHPHACVGEIGLDKQWVPPGYEEVQYDAQMEVFRKQLDIATRLQRPVSMHCVAAYGDVFDILRSASDLPPAIYMHAFGGKAGMLSNFVKMKRFGARFYFGFSAAVNLRSPKTPQVIQLVPDDRLLLESDLEDAAAVQPCLAQMVEVIAEAKGWSLEQAAGHTQRNAQAFVRA